MFAGQLLLQRPVQQRLETECNSAQVIEETCTPNWNVIQQLSQNSEDIAILSMQSAYYSAFITRL
jgi:hypothetical protein